MNAHSAAGRLLGGVAILALVAGCAAGASATPLPASPTPTGGPSATVAAPTPISSPSPTTAGPITYGPVSVVTGTNTCSTMDWTVTTDSDGTQHVRSGTVDCTMKSDDPRVSGRHTAPATLGLDVWGNLDALDFSLVQWATVRTENADGAWEGRLSGVATLPGRGDLIVNWYKGTGGYAGLATLS